MTYIPRIKSLEVIDLIPGTQVIMCQVPLGFRTSNYERGETIDRNRITERKKCRQRVGEAGVMIDKRGREMRRERKTCEKGDKKGKREKERQVRG